MSATLPKPLSPHYSYLELENAGFKSQTLSVDDALDNEQEVYLSIPFPPPKGDKIGLEKAFKEWYNYHTFISLWESLYAVGSQIYDVVDVVGIHKGTYYAIIGSLRGKGELVFKGVPLEPDRIEMDLPSHEVVIGAVTNSLREFCPSFAMVFGSFRCGSPVVVEGGVVVDWCRGDSSRRKKVIPKSVHLTSEDNGEWEVTKEHVEMEYVIYEYIEHRTHMRDYFDDALSAFSILGQVIMSLHIAFRKYKFIHGDFHTGNVVVRDLPSRMWVRYSADEGDFWVYTNVIPTLIDYGRSSLEYNGVKIPNEIRSFDLSVLHDIEHFLEEFIDDVDHHDPNESNPATTVIFDVCDDFLDILSQKTHKIGEMITPLELLQVFSRKNGVKGTFVFKDKPGKGKILNPKKYPLHHA